MFTLTIDSREQYIKEIFLQKTDLLYDIEVSLLDLGDFIVKNENHIIYVIERKTIADLCASIKDGRFREQKTRLSQTLSPERVIYLIEGYSNHHPSIPESTIKSAILNLSFKHSFKLIRTLDYQDTFDYLDTFMKKIIEGSFTTLDTSLIKLPKKGSNLCMFECMLSVIPGVTLKTAQTIRETYSTVNDLVFAYNSLDSDKLKFELLKDIQITDKRKLGKVLSKRIYESLV